MEELEMAEAKMPHFGHTSHLCYLTHLNFHKTNLEDYKFLVKDSKFVCKSCGRTAGSERSVCEPEEINE
jgi:hypothetical protein